MSFFYGRKYSFEGNLVPISVELCEGSVPLANSLAELGIDIKKGLECTGSIPRLHPDQVAFIASDKEGRKLVIRCDRFAAERIHYRILPAQNDSHRLPPGWR